jgi:hypothetical protein
LTPSEAFAAAIRAAGPLVVREVVDLLTRGGGRLDEPLPPGAGKEGACDAGETECSGRTGTGENGDLYFEEMANREWSLFLTSRQR